MSQSIYAQLAALFCNRQWAVTPVRAVLAQVTPDNVNEFHAELSASEHCETIVTELARLGIVPPLPEGVKSPLALTVDGSSYADPDAANRFLAVQFGHDVLTVDADTLEAVALEPVATPSTIQPVPETLDVPEFVEVPRESPEVAAVTGE